MNIGIELNDDMVMDYLNLHSAIEEKANEILNRTIELAKQYCNEDFYEHYMTPIFIGVHEEKFMFLVRLVNTYEEATFWFPISYLTDPDWEKKEIKALQPSS